MKAKSIFLAVALLSFAAAAQLHAQSIPDVTVENIKGGKTSSRTFCDGEGPVVISFWATWCKPCIKELDAVSDLLEEWKEETGLRFIAVSVDDSRSVSRARSFASGRGWEGMDFYFDVNSSLVKALNISAVPHVLVYGKDGKLAYRHVGYVPGDENELFEMVKKTLR